MKTEQKITTDYVPPMMEMIEIEIEQSVLATASSYEEETWE